MKKRAFTQPFHVSRKSFYLERAGFTLIELLVVIAILGTLMGILIPTLKGIREQGRRIRCINNLRQHGMAWLMYLDDHNECFPTYVMNPQEGETDEFAFGGKKGAQVNYPSAATRILNKYFDIADESSPNIDLFYCRSDINNFAGNINRFDEYGNSYEANKNIFQYKPSGGGGPHNYESRPLSTITYPKDIVFLERDNPYNNKGHGKKNADDILLMVLFLDGHAKGPYQAVSDFESENKLPIDTNKKILTYPNDTDDTGN